MTRIGIGLPGPDTLPPHEIPTFAAQADRAGFATLSMADIVVGDGSEAMEPVATVGAMAGVTSRIELGFGVLPIPTRPLPMVAAQVQALQHLSGGRVRLGLGIGGFPDSPFWRGVAADRDHRGGQLDRALDLLPALIAGEPTILADGTELTLQPGAAIPPLAIGSGDADVALQRIATKADEWLASAVTPEQVASAAATLRGYAAAADRPMPKISVGLHAVLGEDSVARETRTRLQRELGSFFELDPAEVAAVMLTGSAEQVAERVAEYAAAGATEVAAAIDGPGPNRQLDLLAEVVRRED